MKNQECFQALLIILYWCKDTQGRGSCTDAGYFRCCDFTNASNGLTFCQDPEGLCYCDFQCHSLLDCCEDIDRICPNSMCASAGYSNCCTSGTCKTTKGCYCDSHCHSVGDCCPDISQICPRNESDRYKNKTQRPSRPQSTSITAHQLHGGVSVRELTSWIIVAILFSMLFTTIVVTAIVIICKKKKRVSSTNQVDFSQYYKMEDNPCYETTTFTHVATTTTTHAQARTQDYRHLY